MAKPKTIKAPKDIDPAQASKPELVKKLREFARYVVHMEAQVADCNKMIKELEGQVLEQQKFMIQQQSEISYQDRLKAEEFKAVEDRLGKVDDSLAQLHTYFIQEPHASVPIP